MITINHQITQNRKILCFSFVGMCCVFIGIGIGRFSYTPIIPSLIDQGWVTKAGAGYLGTANFLGYFLGAILANKISKYFGILNTIKYSLFICISGLFLCSINLNFIWLASLRFFIGISGAFLFILTPGIILKKIPPSHRGMASGFIFTGSGLGIVTSGLLLPYLAKKAVMFSWIGAGGLALIAALLSWPVFSKLNQQTDENIVSYQKASNYNSKRTIIILSCAYQVFPKVSRILKYFSIF